MLKILRTRFQQGYRTISFPIGEAVLPDRFRGRPVINNNQSCPPGCECCLSVCPTGAIHSISGRISLDMGKCLFCNACVDSCPKGKIRLSEEYRIAARKREDLVISNDELKLAAALDAKCKRVFGRSLALRQVSAGGCNACEADTNVLTTIAYDLGRFGIHFVASPRHADGVLITGPVTKNMQLALQKTYDAIPSPKFVIAVGACSISGGPYLDHPETNNGAESLLPVDLFIPGCPPHPLSILDGLLRLLNRIR